MKKHSLLLAIAAIFLLFVSCNPETPVSDTGTLKVLINDSQTRSIESNVPLETKKYIIQLEPEVPGTAEIISEEIIADVHEKSIQVTTGNWMVTVWAVNSRGEKIGIGKTQAVIERNKVSSCQVTVEERKETGILNVRISGVHPQYAISATIQKSLADPSPVPVNLDKADNVYYGTEELESGSYIFVVYLQGQPFWTEAIRVVADGQTNADVLASEGDRITISQKADLPLNTISSDTLVEGSSISNDTTYVFHSRIPARWYVDGKPAETGSSTVFNWHTSGLEKESWHYVGALTGSPDFEMMATMHLVSADSPATPIVNAVIEDRVYTAGDYLAIRFENLPEGDVIIDFDIGDNIGFSNYVVRSHYPEVDVDLPPAMIPGRYPITFTHVAGPVVQIPTITLDVEAAVFNPMAIQIKPEAYNGDGVRVYVPEALPAGVSAELLLDGSSRQNIVIGKGTRDGRFPLSNVSLGSHEVEVIFRNAGNTLELTGNKRTVEFKEYVMPEISLSFREPVNPGSMACLVLSQPLEVDLAVDVHFPDGTDRQVYFESGSEEGRIWIPGDLQPGEYQLTFTSSFNGTPLTIAPLTFTVEKIQPVELTVDAPAFVNESDWEMAIRMPNNINDIIEISWYMDDVRIESSYKDQGDEYVSMYLQNLTLGEHVLKAEARVNGTPACISPFKITVVQDAVSCYVDNTFGNNDVTYGLTVELFRNNDLIPRDPVITARITDYATLDEKIPLENNVQTRWTYTGKKPFLNLIYEVSTPDGKLLFRNRYGLDSFLATLNGPREVILSSANRELRATYEAVLNRSDLDWGGPFNYTLRLDDSFIENSHDITWTLAMCGKHRVQFYADYEHSMNYIGAMDVFVTEEALDPGISLEINGIRRSSRNNNSFGFEVEGNVPIDPKHMVVSITHNGKDISSNGDCRFRQLDQNNVSVESFIFSDMPTSGTIQFNVSLLNDAGRIVQKKSVEYAVSDFYPIVYGEYHRGLKSRLYFEVVGSRLGENISFYVDDKKVDVLNEGENTKYIELDTLPYGPHTLVAKSDSDVNRVSESYSWCTVSDTIYSMTDLVGTPGPEIKVNLQFFGDPALQLPSTVTYELWYQYRGKEKVSLVPNSTGEFTIPADVPDGVKLAIGYKSTCGNIVIEKKYNRYVRNCAINGIPDTIKASELPASFNISLDWYKDLLTYSNYDYSWELGNTPVGGNSRTATIDIPAGSENVTVWCELTSKQNRDVSVWIYKDIEIIK